ERLVWRPGRARAGAVVVAPDGAGVMPGAKEHVRVAVDVAPQASGPDGELRAVHPDGVTAGVVLPVVDVQLHRLAHLSKVRGAFDHLRLLAGLVQGRQEN